MRIFFLYKGSQANDKSLTLLTAACTKLHIESVSVDIEKFDFTNTENLPLAGDLLYRIAAGNLARTIEKFLLRDGVTTFYQKNEQAYFFPDDLALYMRHNLPTPKTIPALSTDPQILKNAVSFVGGYPIILKTLGKSHGEGLMKIDSLETLVAAIDTINLEGGRTVMKEFIPHNKHARIIVLGNRVIDSIAYLSQGNDFRTNAGNEIVVAPEKFSSEIESIAIKAVGVNGWEFGGVDIIINEKNNQPYLAEVNFPCFFPRAEELTGVPIAEKMISYLIKKSQLSS